MQAMILAAGFGTRMRPLTLTTPKPLLQAAGKPLIVYHIESLARAGIRELVINTGWLGNKLEAALGDGSRFGVSIAYSRESEPLETAGGIRHALSLLGSAPFVVVNGDIWCDYDFVHLPSTLNGLAHLVLVDNPPHHRQGDFALDEVGKVHETGSPAYTFAGIGVYRPELLALQPEADKLGMLLRAAMQQGQVTGEYFAGNWWDIGTPERLDALDGFLRQQA